MTKIQTPVRGIDVIADPQELADRMVALSAVNAKRAADIIKEPIRPAKLSGKDYFSDVTAAPV